MTQNDVCALFRERLKATRKRLGLSQEKLANMIGLQHPCVHHWESGRNCPRMDNLPALANALGVTVDWLLGVEDGGHECTPT